MLCCVHAALFSICHISRAGADEEHTCCAACMQVCSAFVTYLEQGQMRSTHAVLCACSFVQMRSERLRVKAVEALQGRMKETYMRTFVWAKVHELNGMHL